MKKRALSLLMALCLLLGLIPTLTAPAAAAGNDACFRYIDDIDDTATESRYFGVEPAFSVGDVWFGVFYTYENGSYGTVLEEPKFSFTAGSPELAIWEYDEQSSQQGNVIYIIEPLEFGDGTLLIESGGKTYSMDYTVELPVMGFYDSTTRSEDSYLLDRTFRYDENSRTFYYLIDPDSSMTVSDPRVDMAENGGDPSDVKVSLRNSTRVRITIPTGTNPEGEYRLRFTVTEGNDSRDSWIWFNLENNAPMVRYRDVYYDNGQPYEDGPLRTILTIPAIYNRSVTFYYGTAESATPLRNYKVTVDDPDLAELRLRTDRPLPDGRKPCQLNGTAIGSTTLTFELDAGPVYTMPLNVELPEFGRYDEQEFSKDALIWDDIYDSREDTVFWLMTKQGFTNPRIRDLEIYEGDAEVDFVRRGSSDFYDVRVTIPKDTRGGVGFYLRVQGDNLGNWGTDVWLEDNAPGLRYAYVDYDRNDNPYLPDGDETYGNYDQAMKSRPDMIFYYGTAENLTPLTAATLADAPVITFADSKGKVSRDILAEPYTLYSDSNGHTNAVVYSMRNRELTRGTLSVTVGGETYSINAKVGLPQFYPYTKQEFSEETLLEDLQYESGKETVLWLMTEEGHENGTIKELDIYSGDVKAELVPRADDPDVSDVKITIPATARGEIHFYIHVRADNGGWGNSFYFEDTKPGLRYAYVDYDRNDNPYLMNGDKTYTNYDHAMGSRPDMIFYYGTAENPIPLTAATLADAPVITFADANGQTRDSIIAEPYTLYSDSNGHTNAVVYTMTNKRLASGTLSATVGGETYSMNAKVGLPEFYFYTEREISKDSLLEDKVYESGKETVLWLMTEDGHENGTITELNIRSGDVKAELVPRADDPDVSDVKITIPATCRGDLNFHIHVRADNGGWGDSFSLGDTAPSLYYNYAMHDSNGGYYEEGDMESFRRQELSYTCGMILYYGNKSEGNLTPITAADEDSIPEVTVTPVGGGAPAAEVYARAILDNGRVVYYLNPLAVGDCLLSYTVGGVEYTMPVSVTLPAYGFYTSKTISEDTLLPDRAFTYKGDQRTVYFQTTRDDVSVVNLTLTGDNGVDYSDVLTTRKVSDTCWSITLADGYVADTDWIRVQIEMEWDDGDTDSSRTSLRFRNGNPTVFVPDILQKGDRPANSKVLVAFYDSLGAMRGLKLVPEDQVLLEATGLEKGMTYRFFCLDATGHHPLLDFFPGIL